MSVQRWDGPETARAIHRRINATTAAYPRDEGVPELFAAVADRWPDAPAVVQDGRVLTYRELDGLANGLARDLLAGGLAPGSTVGVCLRRSPEMVVALLAVLKCGGSYLPFDPAYSDERLRHLFTDAGCRWVLTDRVDALGPRLKGCQVLEPSATPSEERPEVRVGGGDIAYINFTSGSTGQPKGVPVHHRGIVRLVYGARYARLDETSRLLQMSPVTFDAATFEIWGALLAGGTCVLFPDGFVRLSRLGQVLHEQAVTELFLTTALFNAVVDEAPEALSGLRTVLTGGEAHSVKHMAKALKVYGPGRVVSVYGPTESTTFATYFPVDVLPEDVVSLPIGRPIQNTRLFVVDGERLCDVGESGEICLAGDGLSPGYLGMPELTADRFLVREIDGVTERLYRTGDYGRLSPSGDVLFEGRKDDQVKVNGFRIELGEISYHLDRHPAVRHSHVTLTAHGEKALLAFVVTDDPACTAASVHAHLRARLPAYMVPSRVHLCDAFPLTATGKVDRHALLAAHEGGLSEARR